MTAAPSPHGGLKLTREYLLTGELAEMMRKQHPELHVLSDAERADNLTALLAERPDHGSGVWVFGYGSLIWNPTMHIADRKLAWVNGWHRSFCLATRSGRGDAAIPGMLLGLEQGGECVGAVLRVDEAHLATELDILWRREMVANGYIPRWVEFTTPDGEMGGSAIAFTINPAGPNYEGNLSQRELIHRLANARGRLGSAADYLFNTRNGLREMGINDPLLERLGAAVEAQGAFI